MIERNKITVVIIEGNAIHQKIMNSMVRSLGVETVLFSSVDEFKRTASSISIDLILIDSIYAIELHQGWNDTRLKEVVVAAISTNPDKVLPEEVNYMTVCSKPLVKTELEDLLDHIQNNDTELLVFDVDAFQSMYSDSSLQKEILQTFLEEYPSDVKRIHEAFKHEQQDDIYQVSHYIKGTVSYLKGTACFDLTQKICEDSKVHQLSNIQEIYHQFIYEYERFFRAVKQYITSI